MKKSDLKSIRREYGDQALLEADLPANPITLLQQWLEEALNSNVLDATAVVLSTVSAEGKPNSRVVLLKQCDIDGLVFYSSYLSKKGYEIADNPHVALNLYWSEFARQVRIQGVAKKIARQESDTYFATRPVGSQRAAIAFNRDQTIASREILTKQLADVDSEKLECPQEWGGYIVIPEQIEFFQGRDNRCHDRLRYQLKNKQWNIQRLTP